MDDPQRLLSEAEQREAVRSLRAGLVLGNMPVEQLWRNLVEVSGVLTWPQVQQVLAGERICTAYEHDALAQAANDHFIDRDENHPVRYSGELGSVGGD